MTDDEHYDDDNAAPTAGSGTVDLAQYAPVAERLVAVVNAAQRGRVGDVGLFCISGEIAQYPWATGLFITLRFMTWDREEGAPADDPGVIRDIKEQPVMFAKLSHLADEARVANFLRAWCKVMGEVFASGDRERFDTFMPFDFVHAKVLDLKKAHSEDDFVKALSERSRLGGWLALRHAPLSVDRINEIFRDRFPGRGERASLEFVEAQVERDTIMVTVRLVTWDINGDSMSIRNVKEQQVYAGSTRLDDARFCAFLDAYVEVLGEAFDAMSDDTADSLMPHELMNMSPLGNATFNTKDDFVKALKQRSRLGRFLPKTPGPTPPPTHDGEL